MREVILSSIFVILVIVGASSYALYNDSVNDTPSQERYLDPADLRQTEPSRYVDNLDYTVQIESINQVFPTKQNIEIKPYDSSIEIINNKYNSEILIKSTATASGSDVNDTNVFISGVADCPANQYLYGFNGNGTIDCRVDQTGGGGTIDLNVWETFTSDSGSATADNNQDTFNILGGTVISTSITGDTLTIDSTHTAFRSFATPQGTSPVADSTDDTLTFVDDAGIDIIGTATTDQIRIDFDSRELDDLEWGTGVEACIDYTFDIIGQTPNVAYCDDYTLFTSDTVRVDADFRLIDSTEKFMFMEGGNFIGLQTHHNLISDVIYRLPYPDGDLNQVLATDGNANLFWKNDNTGAGGFPRLDQVLNPNTDKTFNMTNNSLIFSYVASTDIGMEIEASGGFTGDLMHIHQHTGNPSVNTNLFSLEAEDSDVLPLKITGSMTDSVQIVSGDLNLFENNIYVANDINANRFCLRTDGNCINNWNDLNQIGGTTSPAGANKQIQYNNNGSFGASSQFIWNDTNLQISNLNDKNTAFSVGITETGDGLKFAYVLNVGQAVPSLTNNNVGYIGTGIEIIDKNIHSRSFEQAFMTFSGDELGFYTDDNTDTQFIPTRTALINPEGLVQGRTDFVRYEDVDPAGTTIGLMAVDLFTTTAVLTKLNFLQPDVPRVLNYTLLADGEFGSATWFIDVNGLDADGNFRHESYTKNGNCRGYSALWDSNVAWAVLHTARLKMVGSCDFATLTIATTDKLGLINFPYQESDDVFKFAKNGFDSTYSAPHEYVNIEYGWIDLNVISIGGTDDFDFWIRAYNHLENGVHRP